jgi:hypothetical protein
MTLELDTAAAAIVRDHPFVPRGEWWTRCGEHVFRDPDAPHVFDYCGLAEAAHASTTLNHDEEDA